MALGRKIFPPIAPATIQPITGGKDIINAMELRAFGPGPRARLEMLRFRRVLMDI